MNYEIGIDEQVEKCWDRIEKECLVLRELEKELDEEFEMIMKEFWESNNKEPMRIAFFPDLRDSELWIYPDKSYILFDTFRHIHEVRKCQLRKQ